MSNKYNFLTGMRTSTLYEVTPGDSAEHIGSGSLPVLGTPTLITWMERMSHALIESYLDPGYSSVGTSIQVHHLSPTPVGETIEMTCEVIEVNGRQIMIEVKARDRHDLIFEGQHIRVVIETTRFMDKVNKKAQQIQED